MKITLAESDPDVARCFPVMQQLRPKLIAADWLPRVRRMAGAGYRLALLEDDTGTVRAVAGFRVMEMLHAGRMLYVDDLVTDSASRSLGHGDHLFDWLVAHARTLDCDSFVLDSGTQRTDAHRFYLRKRMKISCFHFELPLKP